MLNELSMNLLMRKEDISTETAPEVLGIEWNSTKDLLETCCSIGAQSQRKVTKRSVASTIAMIYDPMGWMLPLLHKSKVFLRLLWRDKFDWDTSIPEDRKLEWQKICEDMNGFQMTIPCFLSTTQQQVCFISFTDVSNEAMAACVYLKDRKSTHLLFAKGKLSSLKHEARMPKMELNAFTLAMRITNSVLVQLQTVLQIRRVYIFSDSKIALKWIQSRPLRDAGVMIFNRLTEISKIVTHPETWLLSKDNAEEEQVADFPESEKAILVTHRTTKKSRTNKTGEEKESAQDIFSRFQEQPYTETKRIIARHIGLDYFGPLPVTLTDGSQGECYGAILTCMVTRIIHLDVACDLSRVLRRFFGRRGIPRTITSENAPTFTTGESILKDCVQALERNPTLSRELGNREIEWRHITPYAPWQGEVYERLIKSIKLLLYKTIENTVLTFDELSSIIIEVKALLNTRPLLYIDSNSVSESILRPIDFQQNEIEVNYPFEFSPELEEDLTYLPSSFYQVFLRTEMQAVRLSKLLVKLPISPGIFGKPSI
ncbi:Pao retrotransposon peptidase [Ancylostoma duodenale]|uniref:Pao retrotransposon peptidase n=1 Tax=Ancylostoma duodenale TaxID=51022 RepID=A0A0C2GVS1_9BILA|nr:Pao retrotransposon peptidase [Ancylostoma duodenale]